MCHAEMNKWGKSMFTRVSMIRSVLMGMVLAITAAGLPAYADDGGAANPPTDPTGDWLGTLETPMGKLRLVLTLGRDEGGALTAELESPDQAPGQKFPVDEVAITDGTLTFTSKVLGASYSGTWATDHWDGTFLQGMPFELDLKRGSIDPASLVRPQDPQPPFPYTAEEVRFSNPVAEGVTLAGTLTLPPGDGPFPAAVLISGSGPQNRNEELANHRPFLVLADYLTRRGVAVLRYDDRGFGQSTGTFMAATTVDFATDAAAALAYLRTRADIRADAVGLVGHSEGGMIAPLAAAQGDSPDFIVFLAGPGDDLYEEFVGQQRRVVSSYGMPAARLEAYEEAMRALLSAGQTAESGAAAKAAMLAALTPERRQALGLQQEGQEEDLLNTFASDWFRYFLNFRPAPHLATLDMPVLALFGELDIQIDAERNAAGMRAVWQNHPDATVTTLPKLNHLFQTAKTGMLQEYPQIDETFAPVALQAIGDWITARFVR
jgi:pimeloyl-ACP methyl ester carboxylesterase